MRYFQDLEESANQIFHYSSKKTKEPKRDIILITGQPSSGKPILLRDLIQEMKLQKVPFANKKMYDYTYLIKIIQADDKTGGLGHYHNWCKGKTDGHRHGFMEDDKSFILYDNDLLRQAHQEYFTTLEKLPYTEKIWLTEFSGGDNINPLTEPAAMIDSSYATLAKLLEEGELPASWLKRVYAVIHPVAENKIRSYINDVEYLQSLAEEKEQIVGKKSREVLEMYGYDDFACMEPLLKKWGIQHIYLINNDDFDKFKLKAATLTRKIIAGYRRYYEER